MHDKNKDTKYDSIAKRWSFFAKKKQQQLLAVKGTPNY